MQWKTLFSIDPVKPLLIACLIHRPRKKNYHFGLLYTGPRSNSRRFRNGRFIKFEHERCEKNSTWTLLKCYKVYRSFKSICACFLVLPKESWVVNIRTPPPTWYWCRHTQQDSFPGSCWDENRRYMQFILKWSPRFILLLLQNTLVGYLRTYQCLNSFIEASAINAYSQFNSVLFFQSN